MTKSQLRALGCLVLLAFLFSVGLPAAVFAAEKLPPGFIAQSDTRITWEEAKAFCRQKGGRLPLINGSNSLGDVSDGAKIDGFGTVGSSWPSGLPTDIGYWSDTDDNPAEHVWGIINYGGNVFVKSHSKKSEVHALCVPTKASGTPAPQPLKKEKKPAPADAATGGATQRPPASGPGDAAPPTQTASPPKTPKAPAKAAPAPPAGTKKQTALPGQRESVSYKCPGHQVEVGLIHYNGDNYGFVSGMVMTCLRRAGDKFTPTLGVNMGFEIKNDQVFLMKFNQPHGPCQIVRRAKTTVQDPRCK
jgi:hypothetical protein